MQSFPSLPPPAAVLTSLYFVPIFTSSPASQDAPLASLLVVGLCFQILWACVGTVGCICHLIQDGVGVVSLCTGQSLRWHLLVLHALFQVVTVFHGHGCLFTHCLQILLQPSFWFVNRLPPSNGRFQGVYNRHARTSKTFPYSAKLLPLSHWICLCTQLGNLFCNQREGKSETLSETLIEEVGIWNLWGVEILNR